MCKKKYWRKNIVYCGQTVICNGNNIVVAVMFIFYAGPVSLYARPWIKWIAD